jgi:hypothetical protein
MLVESQYNILQSHNNSKKHDIAIKMDMHTNGTEYSTQKNFHIFTVNRFWTMGPKIYIRERTASLINDTGEAEYLQVEH